MTWLLWMYFQIFPRLATIGNSFKHTICGKSCWNFMTWLLCISKFFLDWQQLVTALNILSVVSCTEILWRDYYECISKIFPGFATIGNSFKHIVCGKLCWHFMTWLLWMYFQIFPGLATIGNSFKHTVCGKLCWHFMTWLLRMYFQNFPWIGNNW